MSIEHSGITRQLLKDLGKRAVNKTREALRYGSATVPADVEKTRGWGLEGN